MAQGPSPSPEQPTLSDLAGRLAEDARTWLGAEVDLARAQTGAMTREFGMAAVMLCAAVAFAIASLVIAAVTIVALLEPYLGVVLAGAAVTLLFVAITAGLVFASRTAIGRAATIARRIGAHISLSRDES